MNNRANEPWAHAFCSIDPISALAIGTAVGGLGAGFLGGKSKSAPPPTATPAPPPAAAPPQSPVGSPGGNKANKTPSFIGAAAAPDNRSFGQKTLIGQ